MVLKSAALGAHRVGFSVAFLLALATAGCGGAGPYGYAPNYVPTSDEEAAAAGAREYDPVMFGRQPEEWKKGDVALFGIVTSRAPSAGGRTDVTLSVRKLETRNLCSNARDDDSCRVTVSDRDFGVVHAQLALRPEDEASEHPVANGSLVRVVGTFGDDVDPEGGSPILHAKFYRHWPRYFYVTTSAADTMRQ